jgi:hypothetical protein
MPRLDENGAGIRPDRQIFRSPIDERGSRERMAEAAGD